MKKLLSIRWLGYHIFSQVDLLVTFHPFRLFTYKLPLVFRPGLSFGTFIFALVFDMVILLPVVIVIGTYLNIQKWIFAPLIVTAFGIVFSTIFKYVSDGRIVKVVYDGHRLLFIVFGLYEKRTEEIRRPDIEGVSLYTDRNPRSNNYKVCILLRDSRAILLSVSRSKKRSQKKLEKVAGAMGLEQVDYPKGTIPINDISLGSAKEAYE